MRFTIYFYIYMHACICVFFPPPFFLFRAAGVSPFVGRFLFTPMFYLVFITCVAFHFLFLLYNFMFSPVLFNALLFIIFKFMYFFVNFLFKIYFIGVILNLWPWIYGIYFLFCLGLCYLVLMLFGCYFSLYIYLCFSTLMGTSLVGLRGV